MGGYAGTRQSLVIRPTPTRRRRQLRRDRRVLAQTGDTPPVFAFGLRGVVAKIVETGAGVGFDITKGICLLTKFPQ